MAVPATRLSKKQTLPTPQWLRRPAKSCDSCSQDTHQIDRDSPPGQPMYLQWAKNEYVEKSQMECPSGRECANSQKELNSEKQKNPELDEHCMSLRQARVQKTGEFDRLDKATVQLFVESAKERYEDKYSEGTFFLPGGLGGPSPSQRSDLGRRSQRSGSAPEEDTHRRGWYRGHPSLRP